jgi:hypothetical protein
MYFGFIPKWLEWPHPEMVAAGSLQPEEPGLEPDQRLYQNFENP